MNFVKTEICQLSTSYTKLGKMRDKHFLKTKLALWKLNLLKIRYLGDVTSLGTFVCILYELHTTHNVQSILFQRSLSVRRKGLGINYVMII